MKINAKLSPKGTICIKRQSLFFVSNAENIMSYIILYYAAELARRLAMVK